MSEPHWLDKIIAEQEALNGPRLAARIRACVKAEEVVGIDELERHAARERAKEKTK